jgi:hypothetical protein
MRACVCVLQLLLLQNKQISAATAAAVFFVFGSNCSSNTHAPSRPTCKLCVNEQQQQQQQKSMTLDLMSRHLQRHQLKKETAESVPRNDEEQTKVETLKK